MVDASELLASPVAAVTRDGIGWDPARGELWFAGETAEAVLLELEARRRDHMAELEELDRVVEEAVAAADAAAERASAAAAAFAPVAHLRGRVDCDPDVLARIARGAERLDETLRIAASVAARFEEPLAERVELAAPRASARSRPASSSFAGR